MLSTQYTINTSRTQHHSLSMSKSVAFLVFLACVVQACPFQHIKLSDMTVQQKAKCPHVLLGKNVCGTVLVYPFPSSFVVLCFLLALSPPLYIPYSLP